MASDEIICPREEIAAYLDGELSGVAMHPGCSLPQFVTHYASGKLHARRGQSC
jgi:hypothetical protein